MSSGSDYPRKLARALREQGRIEDAESAYRIALYEYPKDAALYVGLGDCLRLLGRRADALDAYLNAIAFDPDLASAHYGLGLCELHPLRRADAFGDAVRCDGAHVQAHLAAGESLLLLRRTDEALESLRAAQALAPDDLNVISRAGESLIGAGHLHDAAHFLEQAIAEHPIGDHSARGLGRIYKALGNALAGLGRHHDATEALRAADYLLPEEIETTEPDAELGESTDPSISVPGFDGFMELTDPDAERTDPQAERTAPPV